MTSLSYVCKINLSLSNASFSNLPHQKYEAYFPSDCIIENSFQFSLFSWFDSNDSLKLGKYEFLNNLPLFFFLLCLEVPPFQVLILCIMYSLKIGISSAHDEIMIGDGLVN